MTPVTNVSHIAVAVRDMDRTLAFWTEVVRLRVTLDTIEEFTMSGRTMHRRAVYLRQIDGSNEPFLVLDQPCEGEAPGAVKAMFDLGVHHFGFWVDDIELIAERARVSNTPILSGPVTTDSLRYGEAAGNPVRTLLVHDPDGNVIQFDQRQSPPA
jgi:catechol 2,3-dioxygenase-like lactoylglutathione lyase family enzyme